jgi:hypothetical protein
MSLFDECMRGLRAEAEAEGRTMNFAAFRTFDFAKLRALTPDEQDAELEALVDANPTLKGDLALAYKFWHIPFRNRVVHDMQAALPGITEQDVEAIMACYARVYG